MAKCKSCKNRIRSNACKGMAENGKKCFDVCKNPICGSPGILSMLAPLIYDEVGINLCATITLTEDVSVLYPNAVKACAELLNVSFTYTEGTGVAINPIPGRPNCTEVRLTNLNANFILRLYDDDCNELTATSPINPTVMYLPSETTAPTYDEDTNPSSVTLEVFTPYGYSYTIPEAGTPAPLLNYIGMASTNNSIVQGLNMYGIPKVVDFDPVENTVSIGITLVVQSLYYAGYRVPSAGRINTPKGNIDSSESDCLEFVTGKLLNLAIRPLYLGPPLSEEKYKLECDEKAPCCGCAGDMNCEENTECFDEMFAENAMDEINPVTDM